ncbi:MULTISPECIES: beta family protein [unclassified Rhizobium]|uniref:beta family protein n=1 Tax=unclassified Rhizobium TaxID=2613769 RepID=UPI001ADC4233|nr:MULTISPECIES: hypothetical protein [unclassified Rhizobium]MBO9100015.1 hypothetical protein [Rhizobium sp. L58/93]QXZ82826.1 hypothetical protein J5287_12120 [Rhizobium sp. K1/93]QXZ89661.1 hypothetical protein J5280_16470 [Rhizobium sp. K15/93]
MPLPYFPVVRTKAGEVDALFNLSAGAKAKTFPIVRMTTTVPATFLVKMTRDLVGFPISLDGANNVSETGTTTAYTALFTGLGNGGVPVIPAVRNSDDPAYVAAAGALVGRYLPGIVVQCSLADLPNVGAWIAGQGWPRSDVDLIIDAGGVSELDPVSFSGYVASIINATLAVGHGYRRVALHSWSAPRDHGALARGRQLVPRRDWMLWRAVAAQVGFDLGYSDSCHVHPSLDEIPGYVMATATVSVRYTIDDYWIIRKGIRTSGPNGIQMEAQYRGHAQALVAEAAFNAIPNCWGDSRIRFYAASTAGAGGRAQWAAVLLNRHVTHVCDRLP